MTIALAYASRKSDSRNIVGVLSDSRATFDAGTQFDYFVKARTIGPRTAVVAAGPSTPVMVAAELARSMLASASARRRAKGEPPLTLWHESQLFFAFLRYLATKYAEVREQSIHALVAGFFHDGIPAVIEARMAPLQTDVSIYIPKAGESVCRVAGVEEYRPLLAEAHRLSVAENSPGPALSVLWDLSKHAGIPQIGGGILYGYCQSTQDEFQWPLFRLDGHTFHRGLEIDEAFPLPIPAPQEIEYRASLFATLEERHAETPFEIKEGFRARFISTPGMFMGNTELLNAPDEPPWIMDETIEPLNTVELAVVRVDDDGGE